jgi:UDP-N-acetylglucosamine 2-epimerase (non-hydrolysing)
VILVVFGTTGELIKLAPVLLRLDERGHAYLLATTGQQVEQIPGFLEQFGLRQPDVWLGQGAKGRDLRINSDIPGWLATVMRSWLRERRKVRRTLRGSPGRPLVLVHGDTMTTVLGSMLGRTRFATAWRSFRKVSSRSSYRTGRSGSSRCTGSSCSTTVRC